MTLPEESTDKHGLLPRFTLKDGNSFLLADALGDIHSSDDGFFCNDTRLLSRLELVVADRRPSLLGAAINQHNTLFTSHLTNLPLVAPGEMSIPKGVIHIERSRLIWQERVYERVRITNFDDRVIDIAVSLQFAADFADIFEVQGQVRAQRGRMLDPQIGESSICLSYLGLDEVQRSICLSFFPTPVVLAPCSAHFQLRLAGRSSNEVFVEAGSAGETAPSLERFEAAAAALNTSMSARIADGGAVSSSMRLFNQWLERSRSDLALLTTPSKTGPYPFAGIPWFATQFGRDAIITALQVLWLQPQLAAGVLRFLASTQAKETSAFRDSQPGKIMHETRRGEMAALREVPFGLYYGGVDTTPLFVMLAGAYEARMGESQVVDEIWNALLAATQWIESRLDASPVGFLDYERGELSGLVNQSWKDSHDSMFHEDGSFPESPIAVVEVQGYAYAALRAMAQLALKRNLQQHRRWQARAEQLRAAIEDRFWVPEMNFYAIAIDGRGKACRIYGSDAGHLLLCGVPSEERAGRVIDELLSSRFCSGWGIRTLAEGQPRYNPMSYHTGSVWPHDTSLCAAGMGRYGARGCVAELLGQIFETAINFNMRLPELYCGFPRTPGMSPVPYPVACLPQAWACGAPFLMLQACLGITIDGTAGEIHVTHPVLPQGVEALRIREIPIAQSSVDLEFRRQGNDVVVTPAGHVQAGVQVLGHL